MKTPSKKKIETIISISKDEFANTVKAQLKTNLASMFEKVFKVLEPPPELWMDEYADLYRELTSSVSPIPGKWRTDRFPYHRQIMRDLSPMSPYQHVVWMKSAQVGGTEIAINAVLYWADLYPAPILLLEPTQFVAENYSKNRIQPAIDLCKRLAKKFTAKKSRDSGNTISNKSFLGGILYILWAGSTSALAGNPIRFLIRDEFDRWKLNLKGEGNSGDVAKRRTSNFANRKIFDISTPVSTEESLIYEEYKKGTKFHFTMPCPHCKNDMVYDPKYFYYTLKEGSQYDIAEAYFVCPTCGGIIDEAQHKSEMLANGRWVAEEPDREIRSYHINAFYSPVGFYSWKSAAEDISQAKDDIDKLQVMYNTVYGLPFSTNFTTKNIKEEEWNNRLEEYTLVPDKVKIIVCGIDVQHNRLEMEVVGYGDNFESWGLQYKVIPGDIQNNPGELFSKLLEFLKTPYKRKDGRDHYIWTTFIDAGDGTTEDEVYKFVNLYKFYDIFAIKGKGDPFIPAVSVMKFNKEKYQAPYFILGSNSLKKIVLYDMSRKLEEEKNSYCHFPKGNFGYTYNVWLKGFYSEEMKTVKKNGKSYTVFVCPEGVRNEPFDCRNYARAAIRYCVSDWARIPEPYLCSDKWAIKATKTTEVPETVDLENVKPVNIMSVKLQS